MSYSPLLSVCLGNNEHTLLESWLKEVKKGHLLQKEIIEALSICLSKQLYQNFNILLSFALNKLDQIELPIDDMSQKVSTLIPKEITASVKNQRIYSQVVVGKLNGQVYDAYENVYHFDDMGQLHSSNENTPAAISENRMFLWADHGLFTRLILDGMTYTGAHQEILSIISKTRLDDQHKQARMKESKLKLPSCSKRW